VLNMMPLKAFAGQQHDAHLAAHLLMGMSPMLQANPQAAMMLQQHMLEHIRLKAEEAVEAELFQQYGTDPDRMVSVIQKEGMACRLSNRKRPRRREPMRQEWIHRRTLHSFVQPSPASD
jgi:hypothetical protein